MVLLLSLGAEFTLPLTLFQSHFHGTKNLKWQMEGGLPFHASIGVIFLSALKSIFAYKIPSKQNVQAGIVTLQPMFGSPFFLLWRIRYCQLSCYIGIFEILLKCFVHVFTSLRKHVIRLPLCFSTKYLNAKKKTSSFTFMKYMKVRRDL